MQQEGAVRGLAQGRVVVASTVQQTQLRLITSAFPFSPAGGSPLQSLSPCTHPAGRNVACTAPRLRLRATGREGRVRGTERVWEQ